MPTKTPDISSISINNNNNNNWDLLIVKPANKSKPAAPSVKRIVYHNPATIVFWQDGTKTVVKCMDGEPFEKYAGFCAALAKKVFGSTSKAKKVAGAKKKDEVEE